MPAPLARGLGLYREHGRIVSPHYVDEDAALGALRDETQFNVIELATGWMVDLIMLKARAFSRQEFARRTTTMFLGESLAIATAEDLIVAKLEWANLGGSARQLEDVASILRVRAGELDIAHIEQWAESLSVTIEWLAARRVAELRG